MPKVYEALPALPGKNHFTLSTTPSTTTDSAAQRPSCQLGWWLLVEPIGVIETRRGSDQPVDRYHIQGVFGLLIASDTAAWEPLSQWAVPQTFKLIFGYAVRKQCAEPPDSHAPGLAPRV
jgi:hypothetical protein